jgi:hypothetical protein
MLKITIIMEMNVIICNVLFFFLLIQVSSSFFSDARVSILPKVNNEYSELEFDAHDVYNVGCIDGE